jgi:tripartite-type tricarboxylate transporter receptor subunit TctC
MNFKFLCRPTLCFLGLFWACNPALMAQPANWPSKPLKILVGSQAGTGTDAVTRLVAAKVSEVLGQPIYIENKLGAGGQMAADQVSKATPDGYTLISISSAHASQAATLKTVPFDPVDGLTWISTIAVYPLVIAVAQDSPITSLQDMIRKARAAPGTISYASSGIGSALHLVGEWLATESDIQITHIPFPAGGGFGYTDVMAGRVSMMINIPSLIVPNVRAQKMRALAVTSAERYAPLPNVPALSEVVPGLEVDSWLGFAAPAGTPVDIIKKLNAALKTVLDNKDLQLQMQKTGVQPQWTSPEGFRSVVEKGIVRYRSIARSKNIELQ